MPLVKSMLTMVLCSHFVQSSKAAHFQRVITAEGEAQKPVPAQQFSENAKPSFTQSAEEAETVQKTVQECKDLNGQCSASWVTCDAWWSQQCPKKCGICQANICSQGIIDHSGTVCCDKACGECGGTGCGGRPGGGAKCCSGTIKNSGKICSAALDTACNIQASGTDSSGVDNNVCPVGVCHVCDECLRATMNAHCGTGAAMHCTSAACTGPSVCPIANHCMTEAQYNLRHCIEKSGKIPGYAPGTAVDSKIFACMTQILCKASHTEQCTDWRKQNCGTGNGLLQQQHNLTTKQNQVKTKVAVASDGAAWAVTMARRSNKEQEQSKEVDAALDTSLDGKCS